LKHVVQLVQLLLRSGFSFFLIQAFHLFDQNEKRGGISREEVKMGREQKEENGKKRRESTCISKCWFSIANVFTMCSSISCCVRKKKKKQNKMVLCEMFLIFFGTVPLLTQCTQMRPKQFCSLRNFQTKMLRRGMCFSSGWKAL
jgi:hypothetical protein